MLTVALTSSYITIQNSRPTQAESLLYRLGCVVDNLLLGNCPPSSSQTKPSQEPAPAPTQNTSGGARTGSGEVSPQQPTMTPEPIEFNETPLPLSAVPPVDNMSTKKGILSSVYQLPSSSGNAASADVLGVQRDAPVIAATRHGWEILGIAWYWWTVGILGVTGLYMAVKLLLTKSSLGIVK